jgi:hypothetical protein
MRRRYVPYAANPGATAQVRFAAIGADDVLHELLVCRVTGCVI